MKKVQRTDPGQTGNVYANHIIAERKDGEKGSGKGKVKTLEEGRQKTGIELAREKFAQNKAKKGTGVNKITA